MKTDRGTLPSSWSRIMPLLYTRQPSRRLVPSPTAPGSRRSAQAMTLTGSFLVAQPSLADPNFRESVVLLLAHGDGGAYGIIVNRPVPVANLSVPLFLGGPCRSPGV